MKKRSLFLTYIIFIYLLSTNGNIALSKNLNNSQNAEKIKLIRLLTVLGNEYDGYFTFEKKIESASFDELYESELRGPFVTREFASEGIEREVSSLRSQLPNFSFRICRTSPMIVEVIDARLLEDPNYSLNKIIDLEYEGSFFGLIERIKSQEKLLISTDIPRDSNPASLSLQSTWAVKIKSEKLSTRSVLTKALVDSKFNGDNRILWQSRTENIKEKKITYIF